jgi:hypothetical protein
VHALVLLAYNCLAHIESEHAVTKAVQVLHSADPACLTSLPSTVGLGAFADDSEKAISI